MRDIDLSLFFYCRQGKDEEKMRKNGKTKETILSMAGTLAAMRCFCTGTVSGVCMAADNRHLYGFPLGALERKAEKKNRTGKGENNADCRP